MAADKKTKMLTIQHVDSGVKDEVTQEVYDSLQERIKAKYKIIGSAEVRTPAELESSSN